MKSMEKPVAKKEASAPDPEVEPRAARRRFTAEYKKRILRQLDACGHGEVGALLRREGLYSSHIETWRTQRERGEDEGLSPKKRGRKPVARNPLQAEVEKLRRDNARLASRLKQAELIIDVQKKVSLMLGIIPTTPATDEEQT
jgi:transposase